MPSRQLVADMEAAKDHLWKKHGSTALRYQWNISIAASEHCHCLKPGVLHLLALRADRICAQLRFAFGDLKGSVKANLWDYWSRFAIRPLSCLSCPVCDVGVLWPNGWRDQDETWHGGRPRPRPHCVRWGPISLQKGHSVPIFGPCIVAKWLDGTHLSYCWARVQQSECPSVAKPTASKCDISENQNLIVHPAWVM